MLLVVRREGLRLLSLVGDRGSVAKLWLLQAAPGQGTQADTRLGSMGWRSDSSSVSQNVL